MGCFDTLAHAEEAMRANADNGKEGCARWGKVKDYYDGCLGYYISERRVHRRLPEYGDHALQWRSYTADGDLNDRSMVGFDEQFHGRTAEDIRFQIGDIVEVVAHGNAELAIVAGLPPSVEWVREREAYCREHHPERPFRLDDTDDCYMVYPVDGEDGNHDHVPCFNVLRPTRKVPEMIAKKLLERLERMQNQTCQNH